MDANSCLTLANMENPLTTPFNSISKNPMDLTYYLDMIILETDKMIRLYGERQESATEMDKYTLLGLFTKIEDIAKMAVNDLLREEG